MAKILLTLTIVCVFGAVLVKGFDKEKAIAGFMAKMDDCKAEVGAKDSMYHRLKYINLNGLLIFR